MLLSRSMFRSSLRSRPSSAVCRWVLYASFAIVIWTVASDAYSQGLGRFRQQFGRGFQNPPVQPWRTPETRPARVQNVAPPQVGVAPSGAAVIEERPALEAASQATRLPASQTEAPGVAVSSVRDSKNDVSVRSEKAPSSNISLRDSNEGRGRGIDSALEPVSDPAPAAVEDDQAASVVPEKDRVAGSFLAKKSDKFDFIHTVKEEELKSFVDGAKGKGLCVVVPHKNFIIPSQKTEGEEKGETVASSVVAPGTSETSLQETSSQETNPAAETKEGLQDDASFYEDYVVFTLTDLDPQEVSLLRDSLDGSWDDFDLLNASLIAEGLTTQESRLHYRSRFESLVSLLTQQTNRMQDQLQKTETVYNFLHSRALYAKYDLTCSSVAASLDTGVFNCVSATILFNCLAARAGLDVAALETTGHAKSRVKYEDSFLDIETTCSNWNRLPDRMRPYERSRVKTEGAVAQSSKGIPAALEDNDERNNRNGDVALSLVSVRSSATNAETEEGSTTFNIDEEAPLGYSFTRSRRPMREISDVELVATIYYNVGVDYSQAGDYERSIASYIKAVQLAPDNKTVLGNLKATINNWAIDVAMKDNDYEKAILLTELGRRIDPDFREYKMNLPIFFHDWVESLSKEEKWEEAKRVQEEYWKRFPNTEK